MIAVPKSVSFDQREILGWIRELHCKDGFDVDATFGNGAFYASAEEWPRHRFDIDDTLENCEVASSTCLPLSSGSIQSIVFDPPFLTYIRAGREGNGNMAMGRRFGGYWRYDELAEHYQQSLDEFSRVIMHKGVLVFKCQDIVHNHKLHPTHMNVASWATERGFRLKDMFVLAASHRMPAPNRKGTPKHARIHHSYFMVFQRWAAKRKPAAP
jgi:tRNA G10  N-methylase Trm11